MNIKDYSKRALSALLVCGLLVSNNASLLVANTEGISKNEGVSTKAVSDLTNAELAASVNPILKSYIADDSKEVWEMTAESRLAILATQENIDNARLSEVVKLATAEFAEKRMPTETPLTMVYALEKDVTAKDILISIEDMKDIDKSITSDEGYRIDIDEAGIKLHAASENAVLYGMRTIQNMITINGGLVHGTILDYPDVLERRLHVDCARKYISKDWFIRQIREMSYLKMNTIQIHFSENLGFRIECETDPAIVSDQFLTKAEVREIIEEARKYGIKVIPSFDSPGHVDQILKAHPEYGQVNKNGAHFASGLDITNPDAIAYIRTLYSEYMELFKDSTDFHIGGDEYMEFDRAPFTTEYKSVLNNYAKANIDPNATWKDTVANYINELAEFVHDKGFTPRIWNDGIYYGEKSSEKPQMIQMHEYIGVDFWSQMGWNRDIANLQTFINKGHDVIYNFNASFFYYVLRNDKPTDGREQHSFDYIDQDRRIFEEWTPGKFQSNTIADDSDVIKGVSMGIWCDNGNLVDEDVINTDISDELRSLATKSWNTKSNSITTLAKFQANYAKLGHVAGFDKGSQLPSVGDIVAADSLGKVTLRYISDTGKVLKNDVVKYGTLDEPYEINADAIYGYRLLSDGTVNGTYSKAGDTYTFVFELYTDKSALEKEVKQPLLSKDYIKETFSAYQEAFVEARALYEDEQSEQLSVDTALAKVVSAKAKAVKIENFPLYIQVTYPLTDIGYRAGYEDYKRVVASAKEVLYQTDATAQDMKDAYVNIQTAKSNLMKPDGLAIKVTSTDNYYVDPNKAESFYNYDKMLDGNPATKCWFGKEQVAGHEILFTFPQTLKMSEIRVIQPSNVGADALTGADIEIAATEGAWQKVGSFDQSKLDYTATFDQTPVRYVRIKLTASKLGYWYQIQDMNFTYEQPKEDNTLRDLIADAEAIDITGKNADKVSALVDALIEGQKLYANHNENTEMVEALIRATAEAVRNDVAEDVDKTALEAAIAGAEQLLKNEGIYTTAYINELKATCDEAKAINDSVASTQDQVDAMTAKLNTLVVSPVLREDTTLMKGILANAISKAEAAVKSEAFDTLAPAVKTLINRYLAVANSVYENADATNADVMNAWINLAEIMHYLDFIADKTELNALISECELIVTEDYTIGVEEFKAALASAKAVSADDNALQARIDAAYGRLFAAKEGLGKEEVNKAILKMFIDQANKAKANAEKYKGDANWAAMIEALNEAEAVFANAKATQSEINGAMLKLSSAYENIRLLPNEQMLAELNKFIETAKGINKTLYSAKNYAKIQEVLVEAEEMYHGKDFTETQFHAMLDKINGAYKLIDEGKLETPVHPNSPSATPDGVNTGDTTNVTGLFLIAGLAGMICVLARRRYRKA